MAWAARVVGTCTSHGAGHSCQTHHDQNHGDTGPMCRRIRRRIPPALRLHTHHPADVAAAAGIHRPEMGEFQGHWRNKKKQVGVGNCETPDMEVKVVQQLLRSSSSRTEPAWTASSRPPWPFWSAT